MDKVVVFDLDDTLYKEIDFLNSAFKEIALIISNDSGTSYYEIIGDMLHLYNNKENVFQSILTKYNPLRYAVKDLIETYRAHKPNISLSKETKEVLNELHSNGIRFGMVTDGRSVQQRNKINALGLDKYFEHIIISDEFGFEKPHLANYTYFQNLFPDMDYYYIGDNVKKDFIAPNILGWKTICIKDDGRNIHSQNIKITRIQQPKYYITHFLELPNIIL